MVAMRPTYCVHPARVSFQVYYCGVLGDNPMFAVHLLVTSTRPFGHQLLDEINPGKRGSLARRPDGRRHWTAERLL
jgi:hypothetical protein